MNCRPNQLAWIDVPCTAQNIALGLVQLQGHVVMTEKLHPRSPEADPQWIVTPAQRCVVPQDFRSSKATIAAGTVFNLSGVPDSFLRPFEDLPPQLFVEQQRVLQELA